MDIPFNAPDEHPPANMEIDPFAVKRVQVVISQDDPVHFENTLYGPILLLLQMAFPIRRRFMLKPQAMLRKPAEPNQRTSIDSVGGEVKARNQGHTVAGDSAIPDYVVVKMNNENPYKVPDTILLIVEVKRDPDDEANALDQVLQYAERSLAKSSTPEPLNCVLMMGEKVVFLTASRTVPGDIYSGAMLTRDGADLYWRKREDMDAVLARLHRMASSRWAY